uniref:Uncharacterized protein n=1 Tax=Pithovirus LCDPAC01 TaxID=2506600 RepID=A0A481YN95_9VIRU|nr:MAG: hypothetical protein LCDPAC01_02160 [Pithovirus LCDPAC01]
MRTTHNTRWKRDQKSENRRYSNAKWGKQRKKKVPIPPVIDENLSVLTNQFQCFVDSKYYRTDTLTIGGAPRDALYDNRSIYLVTRNAEEKKVKEYCQNMVDYCVKLFGQFKKTNTDYKNITLTGKFNVNVIRRRDNSLVGYCILYVHDPVVYNLITGLNPNGSEKDGKFKVSIPEPTWDPQTTDYITQYFTIVSGKETNSLFSYNVPKGVTEDHLLNIFAPYSCSNIWEDDPYPKIKFNNTKNGGRNVTIRYRTINDASFALAMQKVTRLYISGKEVTIISGFARRR